jgi:hypothetical protein
MPPPCSALCVRPAVCSVPYWTPFQSSLWLDFVMDCVLWLIFVFIIYICDVIKSVKSKLVDLSVGNIACGLYFILLTFISMQKQYCKNCNFVEKQFIAQTGFIKRVSDCLHYHFVLYLKHVLKCFNNKYSSNRSCTIKCFIR